MFEQATFDFLSALSEGKDKAWFESNRPVYEAKLIGPMRGLVNIVGERLIKADASFEITPLVNKTLTRLNRDMRFAKGGSPYKDHMMALFYRRGRKKLDPQLFVGLQPLEAWVGLYLGPHLLADGAPIRTAIERHPEKLLSAARRAGIGSPGGNQLAICERYGEVKAVLAGKEPADFARGPHLVAMRCVPAEEIVRAGDSFVTDCADHLEALYPLWAVYAG